MNAAVRQPNENEMTKELSIRMNGIERMTQRYQNQPRPGSVASGKLDLFEFFQNLTPTGLELKRRKVLVGGVHQSRKVLVIADLRVNTVPPFDKVAHKLICGSFVWPGCFLNWDR